MIGKRSCIYTIFIAALLCCCTASVYPQTPAAEGLDSMSLEDLLSIKVTSVSKREQRLSDSAAAIFVITHKDLMRSGATSIPDALRMVPGLQVARIDSNKWAVSSRGFNGRFTDKLLVLIDGRSVYTPSFSGVYWEVQDVMLEDVERIEVIRGPGASLWGANAVNGVINIITKHAADTQGGLISAGGGTVEQAFGSARYGTSLGEGVYGRIYAKYFQRDDFEYQSGGNAHDGWDALRSGFRIDARRTGPDRFTFEGDAYSGDVSQRQFDVPSPLPPYSVVEEDDVNMSGGHLLARWQRIFSSSSEFTLQAYYDRTDREDIYDETRDSFDLDFQHRFAPIPGHDLIWGARYRYTHDDFTDSFIADIEPDSREDHLISAFIQDEIALIDDRLWLILGSKFEHNDYTGYEIQPSGRLLWSPHSDHRLWAAVSRAVRTPSRMEHDGRLNVLMFPPLSPLLPLPTKVVIEGDAAFDSEELTAYEFGYRYVPSDGFSVDLALFFNDYDKLRKYIAGDFVVNGPYVELPLTVTNEASGETYGLEVAAAWQAAEWLNLNLAYHYIDADVIEGSIGGKPPKHQVSLRTGVKPADAVDVDLWLRYVDEAKANRTTPQGQGLGVYNIDDYITLDLRMAWRVTEDLELIAVGQNLLDDGHLEYVQEYFIAPTEIPRSVYGQLKYSF